MSLKSDALKMWTMRCLESGFQLILGYASVLNDAEQDSLFF